MKTILYYFSSTGNSLQIAKNLAKELEDTQIISIAKVIQNQEEINTNIDAIGIIFPVYCWGLPNIMKQFVQLLPNLNIQNAPYIFAIATCGLNVGNALTQLQEELAFRKIQLSAGFAIQMPGNYILLYGAKSEKKQQHLFKKAQKKLKKIVKIIINRKTYKIESSFFLINWFGWLIYQISTPHFSELDKKFYVLKEKCTHCEICKKICPVQNIQIINKIPVWQHHCEHCMACLQWCPVQAIQFGSLTLNRKRYHHPEIKVSDLSN